MKKVLLFFILFRWGISFSLTDVLPIHKIDSFENRGIDVLSPSTNPLNYVFYPNQESSELREAKKKLMNYVGFFWEGDRLRDRCLKQRDKIEYAGVNEEIEAKQSFLATLQYLGLDVTVQAIVEYAHLFQFSEEEFRQLAQRLVTNYCSPNLSLISRKELHRNFVAQFRKEKRTYRLPSFKRNPLFPPVFQEQDENREGREREFSLTVSLFRSFCSWGGDSENLRLLSSIAKDPILMAYIIRHMSQKGLSWDFRYGQLLLIDNPQTVHVLCKELICRKVDREKFLENFPLSIGGTDLFKDLSRLYCTHFFTLPTNINDSNEDVQKWLRSQTQGEVTFLNSQLFSLWSGIPDFMLYISDPKELKNIFRAGFDHEWNEWANKAIEKHSHYLFYEESVQVEVIDPLIYYSPTKPEFSVFFDISVGELDRTFWKKGKMMVTHQIPFTERILANFRERWFQYREEKWKGERLKIINDFKIMLNGELERVKSKFSIPPWEGDLEEVIVLELLHQLESYKGPPLKRNSDDLVKVSLRFYYGPFALKYFAFRNQLQKGRASINE